MVARSPPKHKKMVAPINPLLLRETLTKVDRCMSRLQELQYTVTGGTKLISGVNLSPRSTRGYLRTSLRCKQESLRIKNATPKKSPVGKFPTNAGTGGEWRRMSLPAMLLGETIGEIIEASQFAKEIVAAVNAKNNTTEVDPKTPVTQRRKHRPDPDNTELRTRRKREKQNAASQSIRSESSPKQLQRVRSRINFKISSPDKEKKDINGRSYLSANRVSPKLKPWARKAVLFPNPLFLSTPSAKQQRFCKTRSPVIARKRETPHKFLIKSPASPSPSRFQVKIRSPRQVCCASSPAKRGVSPAKAVAAKLRRSFSPSRLASRLVSPMKSRKSVEKKSTESLGMRGGLKQRPVLVSMRYSTGGGGQKFGVCP